MNKLAIILISLFIWPFEFIKSQNFDSKTILNKSIFVRNTTTQIAAEVYYSGKRSEEVKEYSGHRTILLIKNDSFFGKRKNSTQKIPDYTYELGDSLFYYYFDPLDSTYIFESYLRQDYSINLGLNSFWIKISLSSNIDSSSYQWFHPLPNDTIIFGQPCWELKATNILFPNASNVSFSVFISKIDYYPLGQYQHELTNFGDTIITFSFIQSLSKDLLVVNQKFSEFKSEIIELKKYRRKRPYNIFKPDTNLYTASIREFNAFSIQKSDSIVLNFEKGKFFLDFWYIGCLPCFQSFPYIDSLEKVFAKNKIKFMKLNPININDTVMVKKYCKRHFLEKDNYLIQRNLCSNFSVDAYPSFIFIEDGQIIKKFTGFDESVYDELKLFFEKWTADSK